MVRKGSELCWWLRVFGERVVVVVIVRKGSELWGPLNSRGQVGEDQWEGKAIDEGETGVSFSHNKEKAITGTDQPIEQEDQGPRLGGLLGSLTLAGHFGETLS
ncbi:hypothetical protein Pcinc_042020 [Petrolisthes cinctipes]|uniref:Uncharacterized protein n=1 Tax=Petrolisthes cinctipes TaxID=88211 RepID=A0AAE1EHS8_PETCI|nr:hypothetical protein Pcinc_042020 [Petrolisthes cinctipes]